MLFAESIADARAKGFRDLTPLGPKALGYLTQDAYAMHAFFDGVVRRLEGMGIEWDAFSAEGAPGQFELNLPAAGPVDGRRPDDARAHRHERGRGRPRSCP